MTANLFYTLLIAGLISINLNTRAEILPGVIKGRVIDNNNNPIEFATVALVNPLSKLALKGAVCNQKGEYIIEKIENGEYYLSASMMGFEPTETEIVVIDLKTRIIEKTIVLKQSVLALEEVTVKGKYEFIEQTADKTIINPNASITIASENVFEILRKSPGITIDNDDNISLKGMQGVIILIDEKPTYVSGKELAPVLKAMLGKDIKAIEIIENPSARYDAEGNTGIINIKTNHNKAPGFNGNINTGLTFTRTVGENFATNLNMNSGKLNVYGNISLYDWKGWSELYAKRHLVNEEENGSYQNVFTESNSDGGSYNYKTGADYYISKNHVVSIMFRGNAGKNNDDEDGNTLFTDHNRIIDSSLINLANRDFEWVNNTLNMNYKWDIDTSGQSLTLDADYARFNFTSASTQQSSNFDAFNEPLGRIISLLSNQGSVIDIFSTKLDYVRPLNKVLSIEGGLKNSMVKTSSEASMIGYFIQNDEFIYKENIQAAYLSGRAQFAKTSVQLGLRLENTSSNGTSISTNQVDKNNYLKVFPSVFVQQTLNSNQSIGYRYSYRIGRPNYHELNPFIWIIDPYTYQVGSPQLKPQFTHAMSLNHSYKGKFITSFGCNFTNDLFSQVIYQNEDNMAIYQTMDNLSSALDCNLSETVQVQPAKWWRLNGTLTGMYKETNSGQTLNNQFKRWSFMGNVSNSFTLPHNLSAELNANYMSEQLLGNFILKPRYSIDMGIQMRLFNDKGNVKASFSDVFNTGSAGGYAKYGNVDLDVDNRFETQRINISFSYRFGKSEFKTRANRSTASSEEEGRSSK
ncbi:MAG: outer membrane beta-barrel protein [Bacteroidales bacterium]|nr:outer membrane beta-barrel protein [Bacteroidales bacterium]MCF8392138.1 outer membrane beta-barrel protein [Bacteroidales bacterium]